MAKPDNPIYNRSVMIGGRVMTKQQEPSDKGLESDQIERGVIKDQNCSQSTPANTPRVIDPKDQLFVSIEKMTESMSTKELWMAQAVEFAPTKTTKKTKNNFKRLIW